MALLLIHHHLLKLLEVVQFPNQQVAILKQLFHLHLHHERKPSNEASQLTSPKIDDETKDAGDEIMVLSGAEVKMIDDALESIGNNESGVSQVKGSNVKGTANCESQVAPKWLGLDTVHIMTEEGIDCHNKYIDNLISTEIENEKCEMLLYLDELLEMTEKELIKDTDLKQPVPEEIVVRIYNDEFVNGEVLEKYVSMKFSDEHGRYTFNIPKATSWKFMTQQIQYVM